MPTRGVSKSGIYFIYPPFFTANHRCRSELLQRHLEKLSLYPAKANDMAMFLGRRRARFCHALLPLLLLVLLAGQRQVFGDDDGAAGAAAEVHTVAVDASGEMETIDSLPSDKGAQVWEHLVSYEAESGKSFPCVVAWF